MQAILSVIVLVVALADQRSAAVEGSFWSGPLPSRAVRMKQAAEWWDGFRELDRQIPTLSPSQAAWLKQEYDDQIASNAGRFTPRARAAMDSREYGLRVARRNLDPILSTLDALRAPERRPLPDEVRDWTKLAALVMDFSFWQAVTTLVKEGVIKPYINGASGLYGEQHAIWAQEILTRVVLPFFAKTLP